jgi:hypothetical protein
MADYTISQELASLVKRILARTPNFVHKSCIITNTNIQTYEKTYRS